MDPLKRIKACDRNELLSASADRVLGLIIKLNGYPYYHNTLDAIQLTSRLIEMKQRSSKGKNSLSSQEHPASSHS